MNHDFSRIYDCCSNPPSLMDLNEVLNTYRDETSIFPELIAFRRETYWLFCQSLSWSPITASLEITGKHVLHVNTIFGILPVVPIDGIGHGQIRISLHPRTNDLIDRTLLT